MSHRFTKEETEHILATAWERKVDLEEKRVTVAGLDPVPVQKIAGSSSFLVSRRTLLAAHNESTEMGVPFEPPPKIWSPWVGEMRYHARTKCYVGVRGTTVQADNLSWACAIKWAQQDEADKVAREEMWG